MIRSEFEPQQSAATTRPLSLRVGLLGGSFNPVHNGHVTIAGLVRDTLQLDRVLFIPSGDPPHKRGTSLAPAQDRYEMVRLAIAGIPSFGLSDVEITRPGKSYSIDTVRALTQQFGLSADLYFVIGLDAFLEVHKWKDPLELLKSCQFVVVPRPGQSFRSLTGMPLLPKPDLQALTRLDAGQLPRHDIPIPSGRRVICLSIPHCSISSSEIRQRIRNGTLAVNMLPPPVESYILEHRLYRENHDQTDIKDHRPCDRQGDAREKSP